MISDKEVYNSYLKMFDKLDKYWDLTKDDDLGGLLGSMSPYIFSGGMPIDSSMYKDWVTICEVKREAPNNLHNYIIEYLLMQEAKFMLNLSRVINYLNSTATPTDTD